VSKTTASNCPTQKLCYLGPISTNLPFPTPNPYRLMALARMRSRVKKPRRNEKAHNSNKVPMVNSNVICCLPLLANRPIFEALTSLSNQLTTAGSDAGRANSRDVVCAVRAFISKQQAASSTSIAEEAKTFRASVHICGAEECPAPAVWTAVKNIVGHRTPPRCVILQSSARPRRPLAEYPRSETCPQSHSMPLSGTLTRPSRSDPLEL